MAQLPDSLQYSSDHEWVKGDPKVGAEVTVGITDHAAQALGDIVYVEPPRVGDTVTEGQVCGELESTKAVSELYSPVNGTVVAVNEQLDSQPGLVNSDTYGEGWLFTVEITGASENLLDAADYASTLQ